MELTLLLAIEQFIDAHGIHLIHIIFIIFIVTIGFVGSIMTLMESQLPNSIRQSFRYGKHCHKGATDALVNYLEIPKSWFKHFYIFAFGWSLLACYYMGTGIAGKTVAPEYVLRFLDFMCGGRSNRQVQVDSNTALIGTLLLTLQVIRRFYETNFVQIFAKKSKINLSHYFVGYIHYFGAIVALLANTAGFVRGSKPSEFTLANVTLMQLIYIMFFLYSWYQQYVTNIILVNLRKDAKSGVVKTEEHLLPSGGWFNRLSSPHMFFEVVMYYCLADLFTSLHTWKLILIWVASNQTINALLTHQWYKEQFKHYPKQRYAILPYVL